MAATTAVDYKSNGLIDYQKSTNTSTRSAITDTPTAAASTSTAKDSPATRPDVRKSVVMSAPQIFVESKDERLPAGQEKSSTSITIKSQQVKKSSSESSTKVTEQVVQKKDADGIRSSGRNVAPVMMESSRETNRMTRESRVEALGSPPSFDLQPQSQEVTQGAKVTFKCQGKHDLVKGIEISIINADVCIH